MLVTASKNDDKNQGLLKAAGGTELDRKAKDLPVAIFREWFFVRMKTDWL